MRMRIVKEGWIWILPPLSFAIYWHWISLPTIYNPWMYFFVITFPSALGISLLASFFRDPHRDIPDALNTETDILCPADGKICAIVPEGDELAIYVEMHLNNVHVSRSPIKAQVIDVVRIRGNHHMVHFLPYTKGEQSKAIQKNAHAIITLQDDAGQKYQVFLICGAFFRRAKPYVKIGQNITVGQKIGMIVFGSTIKVLLPSLDYQMNVSLGEKVKAGRTILAQVKINNE